MGDFDRSNFPMRQRSNSDEIENGRFTVTVEFDNDGDARIGMSANVSL